MTATRWYATWHDPRSWRSESCENGQFQTLSPLPIMHVIKRLMVNYDTPRQRLNFVPGRYLKFILVWHHVIFKVREFWGVDRQSCMRFIFTFHCHCQSIVWTWCVSAVSADRMQISGEKISDRNELLKSYIDLSQSQWTDYRQLSGLLKMLIVSHCDYTLHSGWFPVSQLSIYCLRWQLFDHCSSHTNLVIPAWQVSLFLSIRVTDAEFALRCCNVSYLTQVGISAHWSPQGQVSALMLVRSQRLPSRILNLYWIKWALAFICLSFCFYIYFLATCAILSWSLGCWVHV